MSIDLAQVLSLRDRLAAANTETRDGQYDLAPTSATSSLNAELHALSRKFPKSAKERAQVPNYILDVAALGGLAKEVLPDAQLRPIPDTLNSEVIATGYGARSAFEANTFALGIASALVEGVIARAQAEHTKKRAAIAADTSDSVAREVSGTGTSSGSRGPTRAMPAGPRLS